VSTIETTGKQTILVAGATGSIGGGAAIELAKRGARVVLLGRKRITLETKADSIRNRLSESGIDCENGDITTLVVDFSDMESVKSAAMEAMDRFPEIHGLILSAVVLVQNGPSILPSGHEMMFATNVMGPFLFTQQLVERMEQSDGLVLHVVSPFYKRIDWEDPESIRTHRTWTAYNRTKTYNRMVAAELARRYAGKISSVAFNPTFIFDKSDPELEKRWPSSGLMGIFWRVMTALFSRPPVVAGVPIADLMLSCPDRNAINGAMFKLRKRIEKPDRAMNDEESGKKLWDALVKKTGLMSG
jgi:NAD(P)-dependent dehydrogenase (short-subunit alcohol dehydrogenase family)